MQPRPPVGPHDNEVGAALLGDAHNRFRRGPGSDFRFPGTLEGVRHEIAELGQGFLVVVMAHHHWLGWGGIPKRLSRAGSKPGCAPGAPVMK